MGCVVSKLGDEEEVIGICRERKRLMKLAVERRYVLADAHCRYSHSLYAVSAAISLFVARHSTPSSPFLITFPPANCSPTPPTENVITNPMFLQQTTSEPKKETIPPCGSSSSSSSSECDDEEEQEQQNGRVETTEKEVPCGYFYMPPPVPSSPRDFAWDFFNPFFGVRSEVVGGFPAGGFHPDSDDDFRMVREKEGIPELEEEGEGGEEENKVVVGDVKECGNASEHLDSEVVRPINGVDVAQAEEGFTVIHTPVRGRELLDALKDIEDHFIRAYDSSKDVSRFLEANKVQLTSGIEEIKENSTKLVQAITWHRSNTARSSSCKSLVASRSKNSSSWTEYKNELFDGYGGMVSGSHSLTLERLYAWEKKLYEEVKAGDNIRRTYENRCLQLRNKDVRGHDTLSLDKSPAARKDLYSEILVAIRRAESISEKIQKLIVEELQPQIIELLHGLAESWKIMLECHETQNMIIFEMKTYNCPTYGKFCGDSHRLATLQLEAEIQNWKESFCEYIAAQKSYIEALHGWLSRFMVPEVDLCSRRRSSIPPFCANGPPLYTICHSWLSHMENLPDRAVSVAMKSFVKDVRALWVQQGEEKEQKRKVDKLAKELDKKILIYQKVESRAHEPKLLEHKPDPDAKKEDDMHHQFEQSTKKDSVESFRKRLEMEKERHHKCMQETQRTTLNGFQTGFGLIFESLVQFTKASFKMYNDLVISSQSLGMDGNVSCIQGSHLKNDDVNR